MSGENAKKHYRPPRCRDHPAVHVTCAKVTVIVMIDTLEFAGNAEFLYVSAREASHRVNASRALLVEAQPACFAACFPVFHLSIYIFVTMSVIVVVITALLLL